MTKKDTIPGLDNARGWYASIVEMVEELERVRDAGMDDMDGDSDPEQRIHESVLSVEVRGPWRDAGADLRSNPDKPAEYRILLTTGGPALQLTGELNEYGEPEIAELQSQDWGTPWTDVPVAALIGTPSTIEPGKFAVPGDYSQKYDKARETLLTFARCFYFG